MVESRSYSFIHKKAVNK